MTILISSLIRGMDEMESVARWADELHDPAVGVELIAFTHEMSYWDRLLRILNKIHCPISFHGPYIKTEGTAADDSQEQRFLLESYRKVFSLAAQHNVCHVVYHMTQKTFTEGKSPEILRPQAEKNARKILRMGEESGVPVLFENLPCPAERTPLYTNTQYFDFFKRFPTTDSLIDIGHAHMTGLALEPFLKCRGDRIRAYHFHNNDGRRDLHNDIFDGTFDYDAFAPLFRAYTPNANIVLEYEPHVDLTFNDLEMRIQYIKKTFCEKKSGQVPD
ncbi:MAG: sugar phosphate isomerase/epimerase [Clostridiales bacterium]|nr:sugar phosphate isomerase/epimerase [Clostridiales bacterium]